MKKGAQGAPSVIDSPVKIAPQAANRDFVVDSGAQFYVHQGMIGSTTHKSTIAVQNGGKIVFDLKSETVTLGMDLVIGTGAGGNGKASVHVFDSNAGYDGRSISLANNAGIVVNKDSVLHLTGDDGDGSIKRRAYQRYADY